MKVETVVQLLSSRARVDEAELLFRNFLFRLPKGLLHCKELITLGTVTWKESTSMLKRYCEISRAIFFLESENGMNEILLET